MSKNIADSLDFNKAREGLKDIIAETKLVYSPVFSQESGNKVYIKPENLQPGSFKVAELTTRSQSCQMKKSLEE